MNIIESDINTSLDTGKYDVAFVSEGHYYYNSIKDWVLDPILNFTPLDYTFSIFNRWGELIFSTDNTDAYWDGTFRSNKVADGLYTYKLNYNTRIVTGTVHLFK